MRYRDLQVYIKSIYLINSRYNFPLTPKFSRCNPPILNVSYCPLSLMHFMHLEAHNQVNPHSGLALKAFRDHLIAR